MSADQESEGYFSAPALRSLRLGGEFRADPFKPQRRRERRERAEKSTKKTAARNCQRLPVQH